ncbi:phosphatidylserine decarboxylase [Kockovaella imperatae]|uniref:Phosphatidylserine decarboxylase proenzyme 2 n=1 Tax=Kockovaella imperatae TaxID=4999 RepID=A0A1Y1U7K4_9TREE|nr:phosphatidylserine decarboxylase [Kockovaella imperatae]ORX34011.1 phosphatidylserine decarboxylase [Kockovaella imperatae]
MHLTTASDHGNTESDHPSGDRLKRFASKPLRLAASTFKPRSLSRSSSSNNVISTSSSKTIVPDLAADSSSPQTQPEHLAKSSQDGSTPTHASITTKSPRKPLEGEEPAAWVRVRIVKAESLVAKDRGGTSDPFVSLVIPPASRHNTPVVKKNLDPVFPAHESTFDFPLYISLATLVGSRGLEGVVWDKDLMRKEYMGEFALPVIDWFDDGDIRLWDEGLPLIRRRLASTRRRQKASGAIYVQIGYVPPKEAADGEDALKRIRRIHSVFAQKSNGAPDLAGVLGVPAYQGIGTVRTRADSPMPKGHLSLGSIHDAASSRLSHLMGKSHITDDASDSGSSDEGLEDDGLTDSSEEEYEDALDTDVLAHHREMTKEAFTEEPLTAVPPPRQASDDAPKTAGLLAPTSRRQAPRQTSLPGYFDRPATAGESSVPATPGASTPGASRRKPIFGRRTSKVSSKRSTRDFNYDSSKVKDVIGIVVLEIKSAEDLPRIKNSIRLGFDMDPFVVIAFGQKVFRTRVIRHSLNPTWDEKLLFHVKRHEANYTIGLSVLDWDKISGNDMIGICTLPLDKLMDNVSRPDPQTGLYDQNDDGKQDMTEFTLPLVCDKDTPWESKHSPKIIIRAKYEPYDAVRQRFWRQYCTQYDVDETGKISYTELATMLDSLGSTLTKRTLESYFTRFGKHPYEDELTIDEVVTNLEREVEKHRSEKRKVSKKPDHDLMTEASTPPIAAKPVDDGLDVTGPDGNISSPVDPDELREHIINSRPRQGAPGNQVSMESVPSVKVERSGSMTAEGGPIIGSVADSDAGSEAITAASSEAEGDLEDDLRSVDSEDSFPEDRERIINIRTCPLCHRRRLKKRSEQDIVTHLAICASADWSRVDRIVTANYVTSSQAQRKFFTKLVNKVAIGAYSLGANSANILVQDRLTGQLQEEKMAVYVRVGIRVLYKGARSRMEGGRARRMLKSLSVKQGLKYDSPSSAVDIPTFIAFHGLDINEILDPLDSFKTFNEFFYRKLKPDARPVADPGNEGRLVSCADCRMMAFETVQEATTIWIKGREFSIARLLGPNYADVVDRYDGGALGIFRLAPQDYHRFHSPVKGRIGKMTMIDGEYYTVNPQAIRTGLDVYGENVRKVVPIHTEEFGLVMTVWVGAMMVGSIKTSVEEGQMVERTDELGYFAFGGSTIVCVFEKGALQWDEDLLDNGRASIETLVRMGMGIGKSTLHCADEA